MNFEKLLPLLLVCCSVATIFSSSSSFCTVSTKFHAIFFSFSFICCVCLYFHLTLWLYYCYCVRAFIACVLSKVCLCINFHHPKKNCFELFRNRVICLIWKTWIANQKKNVAATSIEFTQVLIPLLLKIRVDLRAIIHPSCIHSFDRTFLKRCAFSWIDDSHLFLHFNLDDLLSPESIFKNLIKFHCSTQKKMSTLIQNDRKWKQSMDFK